MRSAWAVSEYPVCVFSCILISVVRVTSLATMKLASIGKYNFIAECIN